MRTFSEFAQSLDGEDKKSAINVVRKGMNASDDFWDIFLSLCGDSEGMSALIGSSKENITGMGGRIRDLMREIEEKDSSSSKKNKMIKTGSET
jgi:hypothetical protein